MLNSIKEFITEWNDTNTERSKLQHAYIALAVASVLVAGLVGLIDYDLGQQLVAFALVVAGIFLVNALAWALLSGLVLVKLDNRPVKVAKNPVVPKRTTKIKK